MPIRKGMTKKNLVGPKTTAKEDQNILYSENTSHKCHTAI